MGFPLLAIAAPAIIGGVSALIQNHKANKAVEEVENAQGLINEAFRDRTPVYDASGKIRDMKGEIDEMKSLVTNPYANLGVATEAAEIQMEQTDIALANTLDTIAATGAGAGGATALAQAALQSKRGIAADIQRQEAQNQKLRAQGAQQVNQQLLSLEQQKLSLEGQAISAEEREALGISAREQAEIDRLYGEKDFYTSRGLSMRDAATDSLMGGLSSSVSLGVNAYAAGLIGDGGGNTNSSSSNIAPSSSSYFTPSSSNQSPTGGSGMGAINNMDYYGNFNEFVTEFSR
tara:strand:+ start:2170 stop:3039 length:870 start_codon:yes stop_codon:yes gene_type:complete